MNAVGLIYGFIIAAIGSTALAASLGEMASIVPVAGAQYHWTADLAPFAPHFFSLIQGWTTVFAWIATAAIAPYFVATQIQGVIVLNYPDYLPERWHATLLMWAVIALPLFANVWGRRLLAPLEIVGGIWHIITLPVLMVTLLCLAPIGSNKFVWTTMVNDVSGWTNPGISFSIGMLSAAFPLGGFDGVLHMSEETRAAARTVPRTMILAVVTNSVLAFAWLITLLYTMGDDIVGLLESPTGYPIIQIYYNTVKSGAGAAALMSLGLVTGIIALFSVLASVSRLVWAFARDGGLPFSSFFVQVHPTLRIPIRSLSLVVAIMLLISLIQIASTTAFVSLLTSHIRLSSPNDVKTDIPSLFQTAILSLSTFGLYLSYVVPIIFLVIKKVKGDEIPYGPWRMPPWMGLPVNLFSIAYALYVMVFLPFPSILPVTATNMNYAGPVMGAVLLIALADWCFTGRKRWQGPATRYVEEDDEVIQDEGNDERYSEDYSR